MRHGSAAGSDRGTAADGRSAVDLGGLARGVVSHVGALIGADGAAPARRGPPQRTSSTGTRVPAITPVETEPSATLPKALRPWLPMTISEGFSRSATSMIAVAT